MTRNPQFKIFTGPMFGGKTTRLLSAIERYKYQQKTVVLFKPSIDGRYSREKVVTHSGQELNCICVSTAEEILKNSAGDVIAIDEIFAIKGAGDAAVKLFASGRDVLVSSIQLSSAAEPFDEMKKILPYATSIEICPAVCSMCDNDAYYTQRLTDSKEQIQIGGSESYEPRCFLHYNLEK